jgi:hypothetical protein
LRTRLVGDSITARAEHRRAKAVARLGGDGDAARERIIEFVTE